jgi:branched-chain amino acid transport system substrate-binding protein
VEIAFTVIPGPDFTVFWNQCAQQGFKPKVVSAGKVGEFPQGMYTFGNRAINMVTETWWSRFHPYSSSLTKQSSAELADAYEKDANKQASMGLGFRHSLLEVPIAALKMTQQLDDPASIRNAVRDNSFNTVVGPVDFKKGAFPNTSLTKVAAGQWRKGKKWPLELVIVDNKLAPDVPVGGEPEPMTYA